MRRRPRALSRSTTLRASPRSQPAPSMSHAPWPYCRSPTGPNLRLPRCLARAHHETPSASGAEGERLYIERGAALLLRFLWFVTCRNGACANALQRRARQRKAAEWPTHARYALCHESPWVARVRPGEWLSWRMVPTPTGPFDQSPRPRLSGPHTGDGSGACAETTRGRSFPVLVHICVRVLRVAIACALRVISACACAQWYVPSKLPRSCRSFCVRGTT
jgi:hypothetical protein